MDQDLKTLYEKYCLNTDLPNDYGAYCKDIPGKLDYTPDQGLRDLLTQPPPIIPIHQLDSNIFNYTPGEIPSEYDFDFAVNEKIIIKLKIDGDKVKVCLD